MRKVAAALTITTFFSLFGFALAVDPVPPKNAVPIQITAPGSGIDPSTPLGTVLSNALTIVFVVAALVVLFFLIVGAFKWITSGGDKDKVAGARTTIINALVGLAILALSFLIITVVGRIVNIDLLKLDFIPTLDRPQCPSPTKFDPSTGNCI